MSAADVALFALVTSAFILEAVLGFGATVLVVSLGAQFLPLDVLLPTYVPVNALLSAWILVRDARRVHWGMLLRRILPFMGLGMALGLSVPVSIDRGPLLGGFGGIVMLLAAPELVGVLRRRPNDAGLDIHTPLTRGTSALVLMAGGVIHGLFGSGGPMVVYFAGREGLDKSVFRATLAALWLVLSGVLIASFVFHGQMNVAAGWRSASLLPALVLGAAIGERLHHRVDVRVFRIAVYVLLFLAGLSLAVRNLTP